MKKRWRAAWHSRRAHSDARQPQAGRMLKTLFILGLVVVLLAVAAREAYIYRKLSRARSPEPPVSRDFPQTWADRTGSRVLLIGDSRVSDWRHHLPSGMNVMERGLPGETALQLRNRFAHDGLRSGADVVVVQAGINDLVAASLRAPDERERVVDEVLRTLQRFAEQAEKQGVCLVLSTIIPPARPALARRLVWEEEIRSMVGRINAELRRWTADRDTPLLDLAAVLAPSKTVPERYRRDTLHLTAAAYAEMNRALTRHLRALDPSDCAG